LPVLAADCLIATRRARRWCRALAAYTFLALAWPSLGPLPWLVAGVPAHVHVALAHDDASEASHDHRHADASAIPGSPTHPIDHDCAECRVLKHLSRCVLTTPTVDVPPSPALCTAALPAAVALPVTQVETFLPPVRAPPVAIV
jgi:hypothetical protein